MNIKFVQGPAWQSGELQKNGQKVLSQVLLKQIKEDKSNGTKVSNH